MRDRVNGDKGDKGEKEIRARYLEITNPDPPITCGTQKIPSVSPKSFISITPGIPVTVDIQKTVAAKY